MLQEFFMIAACAILQLIVKVSSKDPAHLQGLVVISGMRARPKSSAHRTEEML